MNNSLKKVYPCDYTQWMMETKKFYNITPFNRFALGGCMEYGLIPMYTYFGGTEFDYFLNKRTFFHYMDNSFCISTEDQTTFIKLAASHGIEVTFITEYDKNILDKIFKVLDAGSLIMLRVTEVEAYEVDTGYRTEKSFSEHWILCFGYNLETKEFDILEHRTNVAATYKHCRIPFDGYVESYRRFNQDLADNSFNQIVMRKTAIGHDVIDFRNEYLKVRAGNLPRFELSNLCLKNMMDNLRIEATKEKEFENNYVLIFTEIIKYCQRELWLLEVMNLPYDSMELIKQLNIVRATVMKCNLYPSSHIYSQLAKHIMFAEEQLELFNRYVSDILKGAAAIEMA